MPRLTIQQFRASLTAGDGVLMRAYRELASRPQLASEPILVDWVAWPPVAAASRTAA